MPASKAESAALAGAMVAFSLLDGLVKKGVLSVADTGLVCEDALLEKL
jgi:hypothetical protein